jgi:hypothetical protein
MSEESIALQLRYLQTLVEIGASNNSTVVFPLPIDIIRPLVEAGVTAGGSDQTAGSG